MLNCKIVCNSAVPTGTGHPVECCSDLFFRLPIVMLMSKHPVRCEVKTTACRGKHLKIMRSVQVSSALTASNRNGVFTWALRLHLGDAWWGRLESREHLALQRQPGQRRTRVSRVFGGILGNSKLCSLFSREPPSFCEALKYSTSKIAVNYRLTFFLCRLSIWFLCRIHILLSIDDLGVLSGKTYQFHFWDFPVRYQHDGKCHWFSSLRWIGYGHWCHCRLCAGQL